VNLGWRINVADAWFIYEYNYCCSPSNFYTDIFTTTTAPPITFSTTEGAPTITSGVLGNTDSDSSAIPPSFGGQSLILVF
jgi:hypothetical protein